MTCQNKIILITGTPCTGKTTIADELNKELAKKFTSKLIKINEFAIKNNLIDGEDIEKGYKIINLSKLDKKLNENINNFFSKNFCNNSIDSYNSTNLNNSNNFNNSSNSNFNNQFSKYNSDFNNENSNNIKNINDLNHLKIVIIEGHLSHFCSFNGKVDKVIVLRLNPKYLEKRLKLRNYDATKIHENLEAEALGVCSVEAYENHENKVNEIDTSDLSIKNVSMIIKSIIFDKKNYPVGNVDFIDWILE